MKRMFIFLMLIAVFSAQDIQGGTGRKEVESTPTSVEEPITNPETSRQPLKDYEKPSQVHWNNSVKPGYSAWRSVGSILFIIGILLAANAFLRKKQGFALRSGKEKTMHVLERMTIDHKRFLLIVEIENEEIVLGVSPERMDTILVRKRP